MASYAGGPARHVALTALTALVLSAGALAACGDDGNQGSGGSSSDSTSPAATTTVAATSTTTGPDCAGVVEDGQCVGKCSPELCAAGNTCVGNRCALQCDGVADCYAGTVCLDATEDDTGAAIKTCQPSSKAPIIGSTCYFGNECDAVTVCPDGTACGASLCGGQACTDGLCPDGTTACTPQSCGADECRSPVCLGAVDDTGQSPSGTTYCTQLDCTSDDDCAQGMYCGKIRDFHEVCGEDVLLADPSLGPCIDPDDFTTEGKTYQIGPVTLLRNACLVRRQCAPCSDDADCGAVPGQLCATVGDANACASRCLKDSDCEKDAECIADPGHPGELACLPRFGSCTGDGAFCEPCVNDLDCGDAGSNQICYPLAGNMRGCFEFSPPRECGTVCPDDTPCDQFLCGGKECIDGFCHHTKTCNPDPCKGEPCVDDQCPNGDSCNSDPCNGDVCGEDGWCPDYIECVEQNCTNDECAGANTDCELSPDGIHYGQCWDKADGYVKTDPEYRTCFLPFNPFDYKFSCW